MFRKLLMAIIVIYGLIFTSIFSYAKINNPADTSNVTPAGSDTQVQFNDGGSLAGNSGLLFDKSTGALTIGGPLTIGAYTLPATDGALAGYVPKTDAMGNVTWQEDSTTGGEIAFYFNQANSEIATYETLTTTPDQATQTVETATSTSGSYGLIDSYIASSTEITITDIRAGTWNFHSFANVNSNVGITKLVHNIYARNTGGTERLLYQATSTELSVGLKEYQYNVALASSTLSSERLVVKNYCWTDSGVEKTCSFYYGGQDSYSHFVTPLSNADLGYARTSIGETITGGWLFATTPKLSALTSNGFVITSGSDGTLSIDTTSYESGLTAGDGLTRTADDFDCDTADTSTFGCLTDTDWDLFNNKITNATHTGEATGATALTIADNIIDEANLKINAPTDDYVMTASSTASGGMEWKEAGGAGAFATRSNRNNGTNYQASTDGFVAVNITGSTNITSITCFSDNTATPSVGVMKMGSSSSNTYSSFMFPVKASDYYRCDATGTISASMWWTGIE